MLQTKLCGLKFEGSHALTEFFTEFDKTLCELKGAGGVDDSEIILQLLPAMPEPYQPVTTVIDIMFYQNQSSVTLDFVRNKLLMEEARQNKS